MGALDDRTVLVHAVALNRATACVRMRSRGASLVWCPTSNLGCSAARSRATVLRSGIPIALATDSALSATGDLLDELRVARKYLSPATLYRMVTQRPARILRLTEAQRKGDWIAVRSDGGKTPAEALHRRNASRWW